MSTLDLESSRALEQMDFILDSPLNLDPKLDLESTFDLDLDLVFDPLARERRLALTLLPDPELTLEELDLKRDLLTLVLEADITLDLDPFKLDWEAAWKEDWDRDLERRREVLAVLVVLEVLVASFFPAR